VPIAGWRATTTAVNKAIDTGTCPKKFVNARLTTRRRNIFGKKHGVPKLSRVQKAAMATAMPNRALHSFPKMLDNCASYRPSLHHCVNE
jgi:hypothetical protein